MSFELQQKIKQNALQVKQCVSDLYDWEREMEIKQQAKQKLRKLDQQRSVQMAKNVQEVEIIKEKQPSNQAISQNVEKKKDLIRDANTVKEYYNAWDKFDADKQLQRLQQEEQRAYRPYNPYQDSKNNLRAKPKTKINVSGRRNVVNDPTQLKDKGNLHFQSLEYDKAITCYTECLKKIEENIDNDNLPEEKKKLKCVVLSNRAMTYLKIQQVSKALSDAEQSLKYNDKYSKSYYRRAECLKKLGKYKESLRDFRMVKRLQPNQTKADTEIKKIQNFLAKRCRQTRQSMVIEYNNNLMHGSKRVQIEQVEQFGEEPNLPQKHNHLQQL